VEVGPAARAFESVNLPCPPLALVLHTHLWALNQDAHQGMRVGPKETPHLSLHTEERHPPNLQCLHDWMVVVRCEVRGRPRVVEWRWVVGPVGACSPRQAPTSPLPASAATRAYSERSPWPLRGLARWQPRLWKLAPASRSWLASSQPASHPAQSRVPNLPVLLLFVEGAHRQHPLHLQAKLPAFAAAC